MNFFNLKPKFISYLKSECDIDIKWNSIDFSDINIFEFQNEFEDFIQKEYQSQNLEKNIGMDRIKGFDIEGGRFSEQQSEGNEYSIFTEMLNEYMEQEEVSQFIDENEDGNFDETEILAFLDEVNKTDNDENNFSFTDMFQSMSKVLDGTFDFSKEKGQTPNSEAQQTNSLELNSNSNPLNNQISPTNSSTPSTSTSPLNNNQSPQLDTATALNNQNSLKDTNNLSGMTLEELSKEETHRGENVSIATQNLAAAQSGNSEALANFQNNKLTPAQNAYLELVKQDEKIKAETKEEIAENSVQIDDTTKQINQLNAGITECDSNIFRYEGELRTIDANIGDLKSQESTLAAQKSAAQIAHNSASKESKNAAKTRLDNIVSKISDLQLEIKKQEDLRAETKTACDEVVAEKKELEADLKDATTKRDELEQRRSELEAEISQSASPEVQAALSAFQQARSDYKTLKTNEIADANKLLEASKTALNEVTDKTIEVQKAENSKKYSVSNGELFKDSDYKVEHITNEYGSYMLLSPNDIDPNVPHPFLLFLHGSDQADDTSRPSGGLEGKSAAKTMLSDEYSLSAFNGYIMFPVSCVEEGLDSWEVQDDFDMIKNQMEDFQSTHAVDPNNIAIAGHSQGGIGVLKVVKQMPGVFRSAAVMSGYAKEGIDPMDMGIPVYGFVGNLEKDRGANIDMKKEYDPSKLRIYSTSGHSSIASRAFSEDLDGDGNADIIQYLFGDTYADMYQS